MATQIVQKDPDAHRKQLMEPPLPDPSASWQAFRALLEHKSLLGALEVLHQNLGDVFQIPMPGFNPIMLVGPAANHFVLVEARDQLLWRAETDPVTRLLEHGVLVLDGDWHSRMRRRMNPALHRRMMARYIDTMWRRTDQVTARWRNQSVQDMLVEMRRIALLILVETLFKVDFTPHLDHLWPAILRLLRYISPGLWLIWRKAPQPGVGPARRTLDAYLYSIIRERRANLGDVDDLLGSLIASSGMNDDLIRDQLLTMLIAGHDTSTALLAWALHFLVEHPAIMMKAQMEVERVLGRETPQPDHLLRLRYLEQVVNETLRLYPPIHLGNRTAAVDLDFGGYRIPAGTRVLYSIYLTHRHPQFWESPGQFDPERFSPGRSQSRPPYLFLPFGGGPRNCIGTAFAQVEAKVVLARILQRFNLAQTGPQVHAHMGATLEPRPRVPIRISYRNGL